MSQPPRRRIAPRLSRRSTLTGLAMLAAAGGAQAQQAPPPAAGPSAPASGPPPARFGYEDVIRRARDLAARPFDPSMPALPAPLNGLDFDTWRDIRFRPDRALLASGNGPFRMHLFHRGFLYQRPVTVNVVRDGVAAPIPYAAALFDYGRTKMERPLPLDFGFAGFRLHYPLNEPKVMDELVSFLGASYFRFLGRGQGYGLSARGLAIGVGAKETEEFPFFREFWVEMPREDAERVVVHALLDGESVTGAYQFFIYPARETTIEVTVNLFARRRVERLGLAPLTSMYLTGENDRRAARDYRPELHDSDGLLMQTGAGEWIWRPLRNPETAATSSFIDVNPKGFGLMQRDRVFEHYQDLDLHYQKRPSYWVEPREGWGEGRVELVEIPTTDETNDNIVAYWAPKNPLEAGQSLAFGYRISALTDGVRLHAGGRAINTWTTQARALGSAEPATPGSRRFIVDFAGGDLDFLQREPAQVQVDASVSAGRVVRSFLIPNPQIGGFRAVIDVDAPLGQAVDLRAYLKSRARALTETWTYPWIGAGA
ncbi:MAG: glucan biosynthesis protein [Beijerinckiaceae bacterium]